MKNYLLVILVVIIIALASVIYKNEKMQISSHRFPVSKEEMKRVKADVDVPLFLYAFFSKHNCHDCLQVIDVLNTLPSQYVVTGIVPDNELTNENVLRSITRAFFPLKRISNYKKNLPWFSPTIVGVSPEGYILFELPGVPGEQEYVGKFLDSLYNKVYPTFREIKTRKSSLYGGKN